MVPTGEAVTDHRERLRVLRRLAEQYPEGLREAQRRDVERIAFHLERVFRPGARVADLGGGLGLFSVACADLGLEVWLIDDLGDPVNRRFTLGDIGLHQRMGVHVLPIDVGEWGRHFADASLDAVCCFFSLEHWDRPAGPVFREAARILRPGGMLVIGARNAFGWGTRLRTLAGRADAGRFDGTYRGDRFRGVRNPPAVADLRRIAEDAGLTGVRVLGRNWTSSGSGLRRALHGAVDRILRLFPTLCTHIYLEGRRPAPASAAASASPRNARATATASPAASDEER
jgi:SAM-dependent methyltransferase